MEIARQYSDALTAISESLRGTVNRCLKRKPLRKAISRHPNTLNQCPLSGVKQTFRGRTPMSAFDPQRAWEVRDLGSAFLTSQWRNDCHSPDVDLSERVRRRM